MPGAIGAGYCGSRSDNCGLFARWMLGAFERSEEGIPPHPPGIFAKRVRKRLKTNNGSKQERAKRLQETARGCKVLMAGHLPLLRGTAGVPEATKFWEEEIPRVTPPVL
jgi:hypothetical protein